MSGAKAVSPDSPAADQRHVRIGLACGLSAYVIWGLLPLYLKLLAGAPAFEVMAHRVLWSVGLLGLLATLLGRWGAILRAVRDPRTLRLLCLSAALIGSNWLFYIWAVMHGQVLSASLGYFINPLVNVALGMLVLGERLRAVQMAAVALAAFGVLILVIGGGGGVVIALGLAITFGCYGLIRKIAPVDAFNGLLVETALLAPFAAGWLLWLGPAGVFGGDRLLDMLLVLSSVVTAVPLMLFATATKRMRYATLGLLQYVAPTLQFLEAVLLFGEPLRPIHMLTFACIWAGLALYALDGLRGGGGTPVTAE